MHILLRFQNIKDKKKILKASREKRCVINKEAGDHCYQIGVINPRRQWGSYLQMSERNNFYLES